jgi:hypothetical protein
MAAAARQFSIPEAALRQLAEADDPAAAAEIERAMAATRYGHVGPLRQLPDRVVRVILRSKRALQLYGMSTLLQELATRWELAGLDDFLRFGEGSATEGMELLAPFRSPLVAPLAAHAFSNLRTARGLGRQWLLAHPEAAAAGLVPRALGRPSKDRDAAETALRLLAENGQRVLVLEVAARWSPEAASAVEAVLDFDPLDLFPSRVPRLPELWSAAAFHRPLLKNGRALPLPAVEAIGTMLAFSPPQAPYAGLAHVREACTADSLAAFAWDLFAAWLVAGAPPKEDWAFRALGTFGDDDCARRLAPLLRTWPGEAAHARAVLGLDVLARIGTDVALMLLNGIAQKVKFKGLQDKAREKIAEIADARGLTAEELADRLVPDLGLDEKGTLVLDFGTRRFTVAFDETLKPWVRDEAGKRLADLPKPNRGDDPEKAKAATEVFRALKKDSKTVASQQLVRLELAMCSGRRWTPEVFATFLAGHPLVGHVARRLVWGAYGENDALLGAFRVAEDGSYATATDDVFQIPSGAKVGVVHPLGLAEEDASAFGQVLADYQIVQPFRQLGRDVHRLTDEEQVGTELRRFDGTRVPTGKILGLESRGWQRGAPQDGGVSWWYEKVLGDGLEAILEIEPGITAGDPSMLEDHQTLHRVTVVPQGKGGWGKETKQLSIIAPVAASELLRDLEGLRS